MSSIMAGIVLLLIILAAVCAFIGSLWNKGLLLAIAMGCVITIVIIGLMMGVIMGIELIQIGIAQ